MSTASNNTSATVVAGALVPSTLNTPLDVRTVCTREADILKIQAPYLGMIVYTIEEDCYWRVTSLKASGRVANALVATYKPFSSGGASYSAGDGVHIDTETNTISVNYNMVAKRGAYTKGEGLLLTPVNDPETGDIVAHAFSVDTSKVAMKSDLKPYNKGTGLLLTPVKDPETGEVLSYTFSINTSEVALKSDIPSISGGGTDNYFALDNVPKFVGLEGVIMTETKGRMVRISGAGNTSTNGDYEIEDISATGTARVWTKGDRYLYHDGEKWVIDIDRDSSISYYYYAIGTEDPWNLVFIASIKDFGNPPSVDLLTEGPVYAFSLDEDYLQGKIEAETADIRETLGNIDFLLDKINGEEI